MSAMRLLSPAASDFSEISNPFEESVSDADPNDTPTPTSPDQARRFIFRHAVDAYWETKAHRTDCLSFENDDALQPISDLAVRMHVNATLALASAVLLLGPPLPDRATIFGPLKVVAPPVAVEFRGFLYVCAPTELFEDEEPGFRDPDGGDTMGLTVVPINRVVKLD